MNPLIAARAALVQTIGGLTVLVAALAAPDAAHAEDYVPDSGFNGGRFYADAFASTTPDFRLGKKIVQADNGDVIVAGIVPAVDGTTGNAIGLVRYDHAGVRQPWANPGANGHFGDQYVVYPCTLDQRCDDVKDLVLFGDRLYVLADTRNDFSPQPFVLTKYAAEVFVFGTDGSYKTRERMDYQNSADPDTYRTVYGGGIAVYDNMMFPTTTTLIYVGTTFPSTGGLTRIGTFSRYTVGNDGTLAVETSLSYLNPAENSGASCTGQNQCEVTGVALGGRSGTSAPRIYLSGSRWHPGPPPGQIGWEAGWDAFVISVDSNGAPRDGFASDGIYTSESLFLGESGGRAIAVKPGFVASDDEIYLVANVLRGCRDGIGVAKLNEDGAVETDFGPSGRIHYGGSDEGDPAACSLGWIGGWIRADYPTDIAYADGKVGVVGLNVYHPGIACIPGNPCPEDSVDGELAVIDTATGALESWRGYAYSDTAGGPRSRHSGFWGVATTGNGTFTATGDVRFPESAPADRRYKQEYATLRIAPRGDLIFANGFDGPP